MSDNLVHPKITKKILVGEIMEKFKKCLKSKKKYV